MNLRRNVETIETPAPHQGFLGEGHTARAVVQGHFIQSDPFILLMDDEISVPAGAPVGGPHPHAGFETVTLALEGTKQEPGIPLNTGDLEMMTAGSGIVHAEMLPPLTKWRILQLWLTLPKKDRWSQPRVQNLSNEQVPKKKENGMEVKVYSGSLAGLTSPLKNHVPVIIADVRLQTGANATLQLPAAYNTFLYMVEGSLEAGGNSKTLHAGQAAWLDRLSADSLSDLPLTAGPSGGRFILYSGQPQRDDIIAHGPFIADRQEDIVRLYQDFRRGQMKHVTTLPPSQVFTY